MPLLGINLGKVGFLSKAEAGELEAVLGLHRRRRLPDRRADGARGPDPARPARPHGGAGRRRCQPLRAQRHRRRPRRAGPRLPARRRDRRLAPRHVRRRRPRRRQPDRLDRLLVLGRRPDPRPGQPEPHRHADRRPTCRRSARSWSSPSQVVRCRSSTPTRRSSRSTAARTSRSRSATSSRSARSSGRSAWSSRGAQPFWDLLRHKVGAAAVVNAGTPARADGQRPRPDRPAPADARARAQRHHRRDRRGQEPADRRARPRRPAPAPTRRSSATARRPPAWRRCSTACPSRSSPSARSRERPLHRPPRRRRDHRRPARREVGPLVEIHGQHDQQRLLDERWQRDLLDAFGGHAAARAAMADAVERWRANRAALAELAIEPRELARRLETCSSTRRPRSRPRACARARPTEIRARLAAAQHGEAIARGAAARPRRPDRRRRAAPARPPRSPLREARGAGPPRSALRAARRAAGRARGRARATSPPRSATWPTASTTTRPRSPRSRSGSATIYALERRYGDDEAAVIAHGERAAAEARAPARPRRRAGPARARGRRACSREVAARGRRACRRRAGRRPRRWRRRSASVARGPRLPAGRVRGRARAPAGRPRRAGDRARRRRGRLRCQRAPTRSSTGSPRTPASRPGRWPGSPRAASCRASRWPSSRSSPRPTRRRRSCSTRSTPGSAAAAPIRSGAASGRSPAATRSCA